MLAGIKLPLLSGRLLFRLTLSPTIFISSMGTVSRLPGLAAMYSVDNTEIHVTEISKRLSQIDQRHDLPLGSTIPASHSRYCSQQPTSPHLAMVRGRFIGASSMVWLPGNTDKTPFRIPFSSGLCAMKPPVPCGSRA